MQNELLIRKRKNVLIPHISWRVYYTDDGKIIACTPTKIDELEANYKHLYIGNELGSSIVNGSKKTEELRIVQIAGVMQIVELEQEDLKSENIEKNKKNSNNLRFYQIENLGDPTNFVIGVTLLKEKNKIIFHANPDKQYQMLEEIKLNRIKDKTILYITKKNNPSWLLRTIEISIKDILHNDVVVKDVELDELESFSIFSEYLVGGIKIFDEDSSKKDIFFYEFINDLTYETGYNKINISDFGKAIFDITFEKETMIISLRNDYRKYLEKYVFDEKLRAKVNFFITDKATPFFIKHRLTVDIVDLSLNDYIVDVGRNVNIYTNVITPEKYFKIEKTKADKFIDFTKDMQKHIEPKLLHQLNSRRTSIIFAKIKNTTLTFSINEEFKEQFKKYNRVRNNRTKFKGFVMGDSVDQFEIDLKKLVKNEIVIKSKNLPGKIYIDINNANNYFCLN